MPAITSKRQFYRLWKNNLLGNRPIVFKSVAEATTYKGPYVGIRQIGVAGGGAFEIVPPHMIMSIARKWTNLGREYVIDGAVPNHRCNLLGEVTQTFMGWEGYLAIRPELPMRMAMAEKLLKPYRGLKVKLLLEHFMDESSWEDFQELLEIYPGHTIEFGCYDVQVGVLPNRNTIFWECRLY